MSGFLKMSKEDVACLNELVGLLEGKTVDSQSDIGLVNDVLLAPFE